MSKVFYNVKKPLRKLSSVGVRRSTLHGRLVTTRFVQRNRLFFSWVFNVVFRHRLKLVNSSYGGRVPVVPHPSYKKKQRWGPRLNLRIYALQARLLKHGYRLRSRRIIENLLVLLNETVESPSGLVILNSVLAKLEPPYEVVARKRGLETFVYPIPIWPARRRFLAARLLAEGTRKFQVSHRCSFLVALYSEVRGVFNKSADCFTRKLYHRLVRLGIKHMYTSKRFVKYSCV